MVEKHLHKGTDAPKISHQDLKDLLDPDAHPQYKKKECRVYLSVDQSIPNATETKINLNVISFHDFGGFDTSFHRFVAKERGKYRITGLITFTASDHNYAHNVILKKNGTTISNFIAHGNGISADLCCIISDVVELEENDYIELYAWHNQGGSISVYAKGGESKTYLVVEN